MPECHACTAPIGADSIALGFVSEDGLDIAYCTPCRKCASCNMSLSPADLKFCFNLGMEKPRHPRCMILSDRSALDSTPDLHVKILNYCLCMPQFEEMLINLPTFEEKYRFVQMLQAASANASIILGRDKRWREEKQRIEAEAVTTYQSAARKASPAAQSAKRDPIADAKKVGIKTSSEKVARQKLSLRDKAIASFMKGKGGLSLADATAIVDKMHGNSAAAPEGTK